MSDAIIELLQKTRKVICRHDPQLVVSPKRARLTHRDYVPSETLLKPICPRLIQPVLPADNLPNEAARAEPGMSTELTLAS